MRWITSMALAMVSFAVSSIQCEAGIYKWVDKSGKVYFTDSPANIPKSSNVETRKELSAPTQIATQN